MLTDSAVEEFDIKEDEPWYDHQDLQQDLQLAAELGKTLLDRNTELEESLQQMYATNQEQVQEIEYLTKQVDLLRRVNEQHAKVYEQLDVTARELEDANQKLVLDSRASQQKISSLTETIEGLQVHIDDLQKQVEELKKPNQLHSRDMVEHSRSTPSLSCLKELYELRKYFVYDHVFAEKITSLNAQPGPLEEENENLRKTVALLETQLSNEHKKLEILEEEYNQVIKENADLEQVLNDRDSIHARAEELEAEVAEMRKICRSDSVFSSSVEKLIPESIFISFKEHGDKAQEPEPPVKVAEVDKRSLKRSNSEAVLPKTSAEAILNGHDETCIRRTEAIKQRGISLLNEVDSQYSALKIKYDELLQRCQSEDNFLNHQAAQKSKLSTSPPNISSLEASSCPTKHSPDSPGSQPEYKVLFQEIFSCINKTKEEISEHRTKYKQISLSYNS